MQAASVTSDSLALCAGCLPGSVHTHFVRVACALARFWLYALCVAMLQESLVAASVPRDGPGVDVEQYPIVAAFVYARRLCQLAKQNILHMQTSNKAEKRIAVLHCDDVVCLYEMCL